MKGARIVASPILDNFQVIFDKQTQAQTDSNVNISSVQLICQKLFFLKLLVKSKLRITLLFQGCAVYLWQFNWNFFLSRVEITNYLT